MDVAIPLADGSTPRRYHLNPDVEMQVRVLTPVVEEGKLDGAFFERVARPFKHPEHLRDETLVYVVRRLRCCGRASMAEKMEDAFFARLAPQIGWLARRRMHSLTPEMIEDVVSDTVVRILSDLRDPRREALEVFFGTMLRRRVVDALRELTARGKLRTVSLSETVADGEEDATPIELVAEDDLLGRALERIDVQRALAAMPNFKARCAYYLRYEMQLPVEDRDHPGQSISGLLGVSSRQVRNYFKEAEKWLREHRELNDHDA